MFRSTGHTSQITIATERYSVSDLLTEARRRIDRLSPEALVTAIETGATVVDTRTGSDRRSEGFIAASIHVPLSVLLWRADPDSEATDQRINQLDARLVVVCSDGYSSSWVGAVLADLGFTNVADLAGGHRAWVAAGLPVATET